MGLDTGLMSGYKKLIKESGFWAIAKEVIRLRQVRGVLILDAYQHKASKV